MAATQATVLRAVTVTTPVISYQGRLLDPATGQPKPDGGYTMSFSLYNVATGGGPLWTESKSVAVNKGLFNTLLGDITLLPAPLFNGQELYLGITVGSDPETTPRQRLAHVAYAIHAADASNADALDGLDSTAFALANHTHDGSAITTGTVAEARIDPTIARVANIMPKVLGNDGAGSGLDADLIDGHDSSEFYLRGSGTQYHNTLNAGQSVTVFTFGWPTSWYLVWHVFPTTTGGQVTWSVKTELGSDGNITYYITINNVGTIATGYDMKYFILR